ncbi:MAG: hypothetical protein ACI4UO_04415, partial [Paludibacteraceae bacterium]
MEPRTKNQEPRRDGFDSETSETQVICLGSWFLFLGSSSSLLRQLLQSGQVFVADVGEVGNALQDFF